MADIEIKINPESSAKGDDVKSPGTDQAAGSAAPASMAGTLKGGARKLRSPFEDPQEPQSKSGDRPPVSPGATLASHASPDVTSPGPSRASGRMGLKPLQRTDSQRSNVSRIPPSAMPSNAPASNQIVSSPPTPKGSAKGSRPASRTGSIADMRGSGLGSQAGGSQAGDVAGTDGGLGSRKGSEAGSRGVMSKAGSFVNSLLGGGSEKAPSEKEEDELAGVDWKLTARSANETVARLQGDLERERAKSSDLDGQNRELKERVADLEHQLEVSHHHEAHEEEKGKRPKGLLAKKDVRIKELESQLRAAMQGQAGEHLPVTSSTFSRASDVGPESSGTSKKELKEKDRQVKELKRRVDQLTAEKAQLEGQGHVVAEMRGAMQNKDLLLQEAKVAIIALEGKLKNAQEAIVSATDYGWENDIKLAQARRALASILEHHSPGRLRAGGTERGSPTRQKEKELREQLARRIEELSEAKQKAVEAEDYGDAQELHKEITGLKDQLASVGAMSPSMSRGGYDSASPTLEPTKVLTPASPAASGESPHYSPTRYTINTNYGYRSRGAAG